jgi:hypothetical protein
MSKIFQVEFSNGADTIEGAFVPSASAAMEMFLDKHHHGWGDYPYGRIVDVATGEVYAHYAADIDSDLNFTNNLWVSGEFNGILQMEEAMDALGELLNKLMEGEEEE